MSPALSMRSTVCPPALHRIRFPAGELAKDPELGFGQCGHQRSFFVWVVSLWNGLA